MPGAISPVEGTGLSGSLRYSSKPAAGGALQERFPPASKYSERAVVFLGGQASKRRHWLRPVSNREALGMALSAFALSPLPVPFKFCTKNGSSIFSWKNSDVLDLNVKLPSESPRSRAQPP